MPKLQSLAVGTGALLASVLVAAGACTSAPHQSAAPTPSRDEFANVRATAEAAFQAGRASLDRGEFEQALVSLDQARLNDPDNREDITAAIDVAVKQLQSVPATPTRTPIPTPTPQPAPPAGAATSTPSVPPGGGSGPTPPAGFAMWQDAQGRFSLAAPSDWQARPQPAAEFGQGVIGFRDPSGKAELIVAQDPSTEGVSPELYAARMDIAMQRLPGYALDQAIPGVTANSPSLRRNYTVTQRDASGGTVNAKGFQIAVVRGKTPYILAGSAPAADYDRFERTLNQIVDSFSFR